MRVLPLVLLGLCGCASAEKRAPCFTGNEQVALIPSGAATWDGLSLQRSSTTGRFQTDAGLEFDVNASAVAAVDSMSSECIGVASAVTLTVTDPFTGATATLGATRP